MRMGGVGVRDQVRHAGDVDRDVFAVGVFGVPADDVVDEGADGQALERRGGRLSDREREQVVEHAGQAMRIAVDRVDPRRVCAGRSGVSPSSSV